MLRKFNIGPRLVILIAVQTIILLVVGATAIYGLSTAARSTELLNRIGVQLQEAQLQKRIKVWEAVDLWRTLYAHSVDGEELLRELGLEEKRNARFMNAFATAGHERMPPVEVLSFIHQPVSACRR